MLTRGELAMRRQPQVNMVNCVCVASAGSPCRVEAGRLVWRLFDTSARSLQRWLRAANCSRAVSEGRKISPGPELPRGRLSRQPVTIPSGSAPKDVAVPLVCGAGAEGTVSGEPTRLRLSAAPDLGRWALWAYPTPALLNRIRVLPSWPESSSAQATRVARYRS